MRLEVTRYVMRIVPEDRNVPSSTDERNSAYIEEVLGLKKDGDSIKLVRKDVMGCRTIAYLETQKVME